MRGSRGATAERSGVEPAGRGRFYGMNEETRLSHLEPGMPILAGGDRVVRVTPELAARFRPGDRLIAVRRTGEILHVPQAVGELVAAAVAEAVTAFELLQCARDEQIDRFYDEFAARLAAPATWGEIAAANDADVARARARGRSTTRLVADEKMRDGMLAGLRQWREQPSRRDKVVGRIEHEGWVVEEVVSPCGVVAFVFEGRPNVFADATGVLRSGNTAVLRIGSDALGTARAIMAHALRPALAAAGLPPAAIVLLESAEHAAGWALFADPRLALAVARGSGGAVELLGAIAREAGNNVSLHGAGGAWIIADASADPARLEQAVYHSTDRKVCNTVNTICIPRARAGLLVPRVLAALECRGAQLGHGYRLHVAAGSEDLVPARFFTSEIEVYRAAGPQREPIATAWPADQLGHEWEWERTPEVTLVAIADLAEGIGLLNAQSPRFVASLISEDPAAHDRFLGEAHAPFIGDGFTRWVDGQYALHRPELGLSNWRNGRLLARGAILPGDGVYTVKLRVRQSDPGVHR